MPDRTEHINLPAMLNPAFHKGETWGFPGASVDHIETHAAHVFLVGDRAFKLKKPVKLPYLDFSTLEKRREVLHREFEINRRFTPDIYIGIIEKEGEPVLVMNRFAGSAILSGRLAQGGIDDALARSLADMAAAAHGAAPVAETRGSDIMAGLGAQLSSAFTASADLFQAAETLEFHAHYEEALHRLKPLLNRRSSTGLVRRCHGDMHCNNIVVIAGKPTLFDAIEFSDKIATIDVLYDLAFLIMDLLRHGQTRPANIVFNSYLNLRRAGEDLSGLAALPLFLATRAGVRALVTADLVHELPIDRSLKQRGDALDYFRASVSYLKPMPPRVVCIGGLSGTGKSTLGARLAPTIGCAPGAVHVRSDVERKVRAGVPETQRLSAGHYTQAASSDVYEAMFGRARVALAAGHSVILDAVFARESERRMAEDIAARLGVSFRGIWLEAAPGILKSRAATRLGDASDATPDVVETQLRYDVGSIAWDRVDASGSVEAAEAAIKQKLLYRSAVRA